MPYTNLNYVTLKHNTSQQHHAIIMHTVSRTARF